MRKSNPDERVLVMAPVGQDARAMADLLTGRGLAAQVCRDPAECCAQIHSGAGAVVLTEEVMELPNASELMDALQTQPPWSELPLIVLTTGGESRLARMIDLTAAAAGSVTLLERPIGTITLLRSVQVALNSRRRQYQVRDLIEEQQRKRRELEQAGESLRRAKEFDEAVMNNMGEGLYTVDSQGLVTFMNPAAEEFFGWTLAELRGRKMHEMTHYQHPDGSSFPAEDCPGLQVLRFGRTLTDHDDVFIRKDGTFFDVTYSASPLREGDTLTGLVVVFRDITDRKLAEAALRESEERYRTLFHLSPIAVYTIDTSGVILNFNRHAAELWGREPALGETDQRFCGSFKMFRPDGSFMPHAQCPMAEVVSGKVSAVHNGEVRIERPDGSHVTVLVNIRALKNDREQVTGAINCFYDITQRKQAEEESARLAAIVTSSSDPILSKTLEGIITSWNAAAEQVFGYTAHEMIGQSILRLIPVDRRAEESEILARLRAGERMEHYETVRVTKHGRPLDVSLTISPIKNSAGKIIGASKIIHDITHRKQAESALREAHEQLADRANQLETLVQLRTANLARSNEELRLEIAERQEAEAAKEALRRQLLNAQEEERRRISRELHDQMGQNLTALNLGLKSLGDADPHSETLKRLLPPLQALAAQTARDVHRVALELRPAALDDLGLVKAVRNLVENWSARCHIEADFEGGTYDSTGISSESETTLYRIMQEALNNVAKHAEARHVSLVLRRGPDHVQAIIEDDGRGFDAALQASNGRGRLGLVGIQERLAPVGGSLHVESAPGRGTSLLVRLPIPKSL